MPRKKKKSIIGWKTSRQQPHKEEEEEKVSWQMGDLLQQAQDLLLIIIYYYYYYYIIYYLQKLEEEQRERKHWVDEKFAAFEGLLSDSYDDNDGTSNAEAEEGAAIDPEVLQKLISNPDKINEKKLAKLAPDWARNIQESDDHMDEWHKLQYQIWEKENFLELFFIPMSKLISPGSGPQIERLQKESILFVNKVIIVMRGLGREKTGKNYYEMFFSNMKEAVDRTVENFRADIVNVCFNGDQAEFENYWLTYKQMSAEELFKLLTQPFLEKCNPTSVKMYNATNNIRLGLHMSSKVCWNCGKNAKDFKECAKCVAKYCNKQCQINHWKHGGHKVACEHIEVMWDLIKKAKDSIIEANENPEVHQQACGLKLCPILDFLIAKTIPPGYYNSEQYADSSGWKPVGPSMSNFYKNIKGIMLEGKQNGWWVNRYGIGDGSSSYDHDDDLFTFTAMSHAMLFDYTGESKGFKIAWFLLKMKQSGYVDHANDLDWWEVPLMSPESWLGFYQGQAKRGNDAAVGVRVLMRKLELDTFKEFRSKDLMHGLEVRREEPATPIEFMIMCWYASKFSISAEIEELVMSRWGQPGLECLRRCSRE